MPDDRIPDAAQSDDEAARLSRKAGVADETAAYRVASDGAAPATIDEGDPRSTNAGSGTSDTD